MIFGRVLFSSRLQCSKLLCFQRINSVPFCKLYSSSTSSNPKVRAFQSLAHWFGLQATAQPCSYLPTVSVMQPSCISYGKETNAVASDDEDDDGEGGGENLVGQESRMQQEEMIISGQMDADSMAYEGATDTGTSMVSPSPKGSNEKISKSKMRREKKKLMKKKLKSAEASASLMSELPFALTSPTTWKELGFPNPDSTKRKRKRGDSGGRVDSEEDGDKKKKRKRAKDQTILCPSPLPTLRAAAVLAQAEPSVAELLGGRDLVLPFSGISHFRKEVVFVGLATGQHRHTLDSLAGLLRRRFEEQGLLQGDCRGFEPHLTIMKLSRASKLRSQGIKRVDPALYSDYTNKLFGNQMVERVDLCSMLKKKQQDGYYHTETSLQLSGRRRSEPDEAELLKVSKRLVEDAINRALQQYKQETLQNGGGPNAATVQSPGNTEETPTKTDNTANSSTDNRK